MARCGGPSQPRFGRRACGHGDQSEHRTSPRLAAVARAQPGVAVPRCDATGRGGVSLSTSTAPFAPRMQGPWRVSRLHRLPSREQASFYDRTSTTTYEAQGPTCRARCRPARQQASRAIRSRFPLRTCSMPSRSVQTVGSRRPRDSCMGGGEFLRPERLTFASSRHQSAQVVGLDRLAAVRFSPPTGADPKGQRSRRTSPCTPVGGHDL